MRAQGPHQPLRDHADQGRRNQVGRHTDLGKARISAERWGGKYEDNQVLEFSVFFTWTL